MKLVIPMAGKGTRLRPHSHTLPKPLLPLAGKPLLERIIDSFRSSLETVFEEIVFILGESNSDIRAELGQLAERHGAKATFATQDRALGTAHAILCAEDRLDGELVIVFADTLFESSGRPDITGCDCMIWLKEVEDPSRFGVALTEEERIVGFVEKPSEPVSNKAIIGVYYFRDGGELRRQLRRLLDEGRTGANGEFHITDAMDRMVREGQIFRPATVDTWLDCGTLDAWRETNNYLLAKQSASPDSRRFKGVTLVEPVYVGRDVLIVDSTIGPNVSIGDRCRISGSTIVDSILMDGAIVAESSLERSTIGERTQVIGFGGSLHLGDDAFVSSAAAR